MNKTPQEICDAIALDFKMNGITHKMAAEKIGKTKAIVSSQISGKKPFSKSMADLFSKTFGYNLCFLLYGDGELRTPETSTNTSVCVSGPRNKYPELSSSLIDIAGILIKMTDNAVVAEAWEALLKGNFDLFSEKVELLAKQTDSSNMPLYRIGMLLSQIEATLQREQDKPQISIVD